MTIQEPNDNAPAETDECTWDGSVNHWTLVNDLDDSDYLESEESTGLSSSETNSDDEFNELEGEELVKNLENEKEWNKAERTHTQGAYTGKSDCTKRCHNKKVQDKEVTDSVLHKSQSATLMQSYFAPKQNEASVPQTSDGDSDIELLSEPPVGIGAGALPDCTEIFTGYC
ncbi:hypothetical protein BDQ17DRAFT_1437619 [Cyathus striatus]|nr:hypothetical protein BDQ17DRAFT_1437619 [Cyathus striatus]